MKHIALLLLLSGPVYAETCAEPADTSEMTQTLMAGLQHAQSDLSARVFSDQLWTIWTTAPDARAQTLLDAGLQQHRYGDFDSALLSFDALVRYCPDYAEGYNQRAFVNFLRGSFDVALVDLDLALERNPNHIAALAGKSLTLLQMGQVPAGQKVLREALAMNPWLSERAFLIDEPGEDI